MSLDSSKSKIIEGVVVSDKMQKTVTILVERKKRHPLFEKVIKYSKKIKVHDEDSSCKLGDKIQAISCRPLSKFKRYKFYKVL